MPSLPPFDGVAIPSCAGIRADGTTIRAIDACGVDGKSLPITPSTGENNIFSSHHYNHGGGIWSDGCTTDAVGPSKSTRPLGKRVDGTLACHHRGGNAIAKLGSPFNASLVLSLPPTPNHLGGFPKGRWHPRLLPQRRQRHCRAQPVLSCRLGLLPPTIYQRWGGAPPGRQAVLWNAVTNV
jgi:hypothetical protein